MKNKVLWITRTAVMMALLVTLQWATSGLGQFVTGSCVNAVLVVATLAAEKAQQQDIEGGQKLMKSSYPIRLLVLAVVLIVCAASGYFDVLALVLPMLFVRPVIMLWEFVGKKGE